MAAKLIRGIPALALLLLVSASFGQIVRAQDASSERVIRTWVDQVKQDDGSEIEWTYTVTFNTDTGIYVRTIVDENGVLVQRTVQPSSLISPNQEELAMARDIILNDAELSGLYNSARNPELSGGFVLLREEGHPCGPGSRCLQFDMYDNDDAGHLIDRIRYIIVDVRTETIVSRDFDPDANGNETRFNVNRRTN
ncbi:MAG: hypothetical protein R3284_03895 [Rubricoccaceae bacterium]|nr:hypothetical protein [Rubricoccaceae bacterium]